jgi:hypothetical protein
MSEAFIIEQALKSPVNHPVMLRLMHKYRHTAHNSPDSCSTNVQFNIMLCNVLLFSGAQSALKSVLID